MTAPERLEGELIERLRRYVGGITGENELHTGLWMCADAMSDAADEIAALRREVERLREALERVWELYGLDDRTCEAFDRIGAVAAKAVASSQNQNRGERDGE